MRRGPPGWVSALAEKPNLIAAFAFLVVALGVDLALWFVFWARRRRAIRRARSAPLPS